MNKRDKIILQKIIDYSNDVATIIMKENLDKKKFADNLTAKYAINMCIMQIGEIANKFSAEFILKHTMIPWKQIIALRHKVVHAYYKINMDEIWDIAIIHIPKLKADCEVILKTC